MRSLENGWNEEYGGLIGFVEQKWNLTGASILRCFDGVVVEWPRKGDDMAGVLVWTETRSRVVALKPRMNHLKWSGGESYWADLLNVEWYS